MKTKFLVSKNFENRLAFVNKIKGKKIAIYNEKSYLLENYDLAIDMNKLMKGDYFLENLAKCDGETTLVLIDILIKNGVYVHPYGKIYAFTEQSKETLVIDTFAFKWDEKQIVRPFLFINPNLLGSSMINFFEGKENTVENYYKTIKPCIKMDVAPIEIEVIKYEPTQEEIDEYEKQKKIAIYFLQYPKIKVISALIKYVDNLPSKKAAYSRVPPNCVLVTSNKPKNKFWIYDVLKDENVKKVVFLSSGVFGADEIELHKTKDALERHNDLIRLING